MNEKISEMGLLSDGVCKSRPHPKMTAGSFCDMEVDNYLGCGLTKVFGVILVDISTLATQLS